MSIPHVSLARVADIQIGPFGSLLHKSDYVENGVPVINPMHISPHGIAPDQSFSVPETKASELKRYLLKSGEVIMGRRGEMGRCAVVTDHHEGMICGTGSMKIIPSPHELDPTYLVHILRTPKARKELEAAASGVTMLNLNVSALSTLKIPLPPLDEQRRIAGILDQADALRRLRARALDKLNTLGQAIFQEMFGDSDGYSRKLLDEVVAARSSLADPTNDENAHLPHVGPEHIRQGGGTIDWQRVRSCADDGVTSGKYRFEAGDVIYSKIRPYLNKVAIADRVGMCSADMYALTPKLDSITVPYLHFILGSENFLSYAATVSGRANIPKMNRKQLMAFMLPVPPRDEQARFEARLNALWTHRARVSDHQELAETLFTSLQHRAFRGEL